MSLLGVLGAVGVMNSGKLWFSRATCVSIRLSFVFVFFFFMVLSSSSSCLLLYRIFVSALLFLAFSFPSFYDVLVFVVLIFFLRRLRHELGGRLISLLHLLGKSEFI